MAANAKKSPKATPPPVRRSLATLGDVRRELATVYRATREGSIPVAQLGTFVYALRQLGTLIVDETLEERVARVEEAFGRR